MSNETAPEVHSRTHIQPPRWKISLFTLLAGLLGGLIAWGGGELVYGLFVPPTHKVTVFGGGQVDQATPQDQMKADSRNELVAFGLMGGALGLCFGLAGGISRGSVKSAINAGLGGLIATAVVAVVVTAIGHFPFNRVRDVDFNDLIPVLSLHVAVFGSIGAMAGLAFGFGLGDRATALRALMGGAFGAAVGAVIAGLGGSILFATDQTHLPIAFSSAGRAFYRVVVALLISFCMAFVLVDRRGQKATSVASIEGQESESNSGTN